LALLARKGAQIIDVGDLKYEGREAFPKSINIPGTAVYDYVSSVNLVDEVEP
jgi:hypothetical protein